MDQNTLVDDIIYTLSKDQRVVFAYLYGSSAAEGVGNDIDIAVYSIEQGDPHKLAADLKVALHKKTGLIPDRFDIRIVNGLFEYGDIFDLLYLRNVLTRNRLLIDRDFARRTDLLERYGLKFRECEGLIEEVIT
jgi:predicted nucleotidyltransferase